MNHKIPALVAEYAHQSQSPGEEKSSLTHATRQFTTTDEAKNHFLYFKKKLFDIKAWNAESGMSGFTLFDQNGVTRPDKTAAVNDFIKITLPGSGKDDWVKIIEIFDETDEIVLTVQPARNPTEKSDGETAATSHFFTSRTTNNFCLERKLEAINFYVIGLGEISNTAETGSILETIRNFATANLGHYFGIQKGEWTIFCQNFLEIEESKKEEM